MNTLQRDDGLVAGIRARLTKPIVLIGMMGSGKSRLGKMLAEALTLPFVDSDEEIEAASGLSIAEIFDRFGEPYFRDGERRVVRRLLDGPVRVVATGGGVVTNPETADLIWSQGISLWVRAEMAVMLERTTRGERRPLLKNGDPETVLKELMAVRYPIYSRADMTVDSRSGPAEQTLNFALNRLDDFLRGRV